MQFNSYIFILAFLPIILITYFGACKINYTLGKVIIIIGSLIFYGYKNEKALVIMSISLVINYLFARIIEINKKARMIVLFPIFVNISLLFYF